MRLELLGVTVQEHTGSKIDDLVKDQTYRLYRAHSNNVMVLRKNEKSRLTVIDLSFTHIFACFLISFQVHGTEPDGFIFVGCLPTFSRRICSYTRVSVTSV